MTFDVTDPYTVKSIKRFNKKLYKDSITGCWIFTGTVASNGGYGQFYFKGKQIYTNRFALMIKLGRELKSRKYALHTCDNPPCCNPNHLYEGTHRKNMSDAAHRNRMIGSINSGNFQSGSKHRNALLKDKQVLEIKLAFLSGVTRNELADTYNVSWHIIDNIVNGRSYANINIT